jgi:phenylpropionate dioxygenase-like ring-hydroxylating dioxygenase large terminal subunit
MPECCFSHPVCADTDLLDTPLAVRLLGHDWVLWRDATGTPQAAPDRCPHRGTRLSLGRVCEGELQCSYHGWRFASDGHCTAVPAVPGWVPPASHGLSTVTVVAAHGLLWLRTDGEDPALPPFGAEADTRLRKLTVGHYDVATSAPRIVGNFLDLAHFGLVHEGWLGDAQHLAVHAYNVTVTAEEGVLATGCQAWQPQSNRLSTGGSWVDYDYRVPAPYTAMLEKAPQAQRGYREAIALFICPVDEERSRVWFRLAVPDWHSSDAQLSTFQHTLFSQDQAVLESQQPKRLPLGTTVVQEVHCAADRSAAAYRRYLGMLGASFGVC